MRLDISFEPQPYGCDLDPEKNIVASSNIRDPPKPILVFDRETGKKLREFCTIPEQPVSIGFDGEGKERQNLDKNLLQTYFLAGNLFVLDLCGSIMPQVQVFNPQGQLKYSFGHRHLSSPYGIAVDKVTGNVVIGDSSSHSIKVFNSTGTLLFQFGERGEKPEQFEYPVGVAVGPDRKIFVCDRGNHRIQLYDEKGRFIKIIGGPGDQPGEFNFPWGITVDKVGSLLVADSDNGRLQVFDNEGRWVYSVTGGLNKIHFAPKAPVVGPDGELIVTDSMERRILVFTPEYD